MIWEYFRVTVPVRKEYRTRYTLVTRKEMQKALKLATYVQGAAMLGLNYRTFHRAIDALDLRRHPYKGSKRKVYVKPEKLEKFIRGYTWDELADIFQCSVTTMRRAFKHAKMFKRDERSKRRFNKCTF